MKEKTIKITGEDGERKTMKVESIYEVHHKLVADFWKAYWDDIDRQLFESESLKDS